MNVLSGYKTYIVAAILGLVTVATQLGYLNADQAKTVQELLAATGLVTLRLAVSKI